MGPNANDSVMQWGNYSGYPTATSTILQGIRERLGKVKYVQGCGHTRNEVAESRYADLRTPDGKRGMKATYWNNSRMEGQPATTQTLTEPIQLSNGGATVFAPGVNLEEMSARYEGTFTPRESETIGTGLAVAHRLPPHLRFRPACLQRQRSRRRSYCLYHHSRARRFLLTRSGFALA